MQKVRSFAIETSSSPNKIEWLIKTPNWRANLIGNAVAILLNKDRFQDDLIWRLKNHSWVAPQLSVGIALLDKGKAENTLKEIILDASADSTSKTTISAFMSLKFLNSKYADEFEKNELFQILKSKDWDNSIDIAEQHWKFWKNEKFLSQVK